jgi:peptide/nickel transport system permease protein
MALIILLTLVAPQIYSWDEIIAVSNATKLLPPSAAHPFGTDNLGRDQLGRVIWGGRESLRAGYLVVLIGLGGGTILGLISGFAGGWVDNLIQRFVDVLLAIPSILLALSVVGALGPGLVQVMLAVGLANIPDYTRLIRGSVLEAKENEYVRAARVLGASNGRIMFRHILPNVIGPILVYATLGLGIAIMITAGLSYLGLGAQPPSPEWGAMLNLGRQFMRHAWWMPVFPGVAIVIAVLSINLIGDGLQDAINPKLRK